MDERDDRDAMVRTRYVGQQGELDDSRLAGLGHIGPGHAVDMPRWLAEELVNQGLFVLEEDYRPGIAEPGNQEPSEEAEGSDDPDNGNPEHGGMAGDEAPDGISEGKEGATMQPFTEIKSGPAEEDWLSEIKGGPGLDTEGLAECPLAPGVLPGLGALRLEILAQAGVGDWEDLAALSDEECEDLAEQMDGVKGDQVKRWRDGAQARLTGA